MTAHTETAARPSRTEAAGATPYTPLFIVGCPRSGTTWVQLLLARHPDVATAPETQIFAYYLDHFRRQWRHEQEGRGGQKAQGKAGLSRLLSQDDFEELCRLNARLVLDKIAAGRPGAGIVAEKSPRHALHADFIRALFPDARFLHVVRDPRDTVASLRAAARDWGSGWAPRSPIVAARWWRDHVESARLVREPAAQYLELRYEDLVAAPEARLHQLLDWLGLESDEAFRRETVAACELSRLRSGADGGSMPLPGEKSPREFFRKGAPGGWRGELSGGDVRAIEAVCGPLMADLGYQPATAGRSSLRIPLHDVLCRVRESVDWQLQRLSDHL